MENKELIEKQFEHAINSQLFIVLQADTLKYCGEIIYDKIQDDIKRQKNNLNVTDIKNIFAKKTVDMLYSYALENLLKAVIKKQKGSLFINGKFGYDSHDLEYLAKVAGFKISKEESQLLRTLTIYGVWLGRYTFPLNKKEMKIGNVDEINKVIFDELYKKIMKEL